VSRGSLGALRRPDLDAWSTGLGLLAAALLLVVPLAVDGELFAADVSIAGVRLAILFAIGAAVVAFGGLVDLVGRSELRQGYAVLGAAGLVVAAALMVTASPGEAVDGGSVEVVPYGVMLAWASALVVGTVAFGPTRTAVLVGLATIAVALLIPVGADARPFLALAIESEWSYVLVPPVAAALAGIWRLLDLPWIGGVVLGGGLAVLTQLWLPGAPTTALPCPPDVATCVQPTDLVVLLHAGCLFVAAGAFFGRPAGDGS
jgi:hypothetical protein